jgi:Stress responsive A/B Barrel Domain
MKTIILTFLLSSILGYAVGRAQGTSKKLKKGVVHTVYFWLKSPQSTADKTMLIQGLQSLLAVKEIQTAWIGEPAKTMDRPVIDASYQVSITFVFKNSSDQDAYQVHPIHEKFVETHKHLWERVQVYDAVSQ